MHITKGATASPQPYQPCPIYTIPKEPNTFPYSACLARFKGTTDQEELRLGNSGSDTPDVSDTSLPLPHIHTRLLLSLFSLRLFLSSCSSFFFPSAVAIRNDNTFRTGDPFREAAPVPRTVGKEVGGQENQADGLTAHHIPGVESFDACTQCKSCNFGIIVNGCQWSMLVVFWHVSFSTDRFPAKPAAD